MLTKKIHRQLTYSEKTPPSSDTTDGPAVAMTVASMATSAVDSMIPMRTGPRSDRKPTPDAATCPMLTVARLGQLRAQRPDGRLRPRLAAGGFSGAAISL